MSVAHSMTEADFHESSGVPESPGAKLRQKFPIFEAQKRRVEGREFALSYLDSAASTQKPAVVIERLRHYLASEHANIHRGAYALSAEATRLYDDARARVAQFFKCSPRSIIFTRGTTESINLIAYSLQAQFKRGDVVLVTSLEHHSNIVPWQLLAERTGVRVEFVAIDSHASLDMQHFATQLKTLRPKLVAFTAVSNAFGTILEIPQLVNAAREIGAFTVIDAAQAAAHMPIDVLKLDCDFLAVSAHKLYGPTGVGALFVREALYDQMQPFQGGGDMIETVTEQGSTWADAPQKFEAGTPAIAEAVAFGTALEFIQSIGLDRIHAHEESLLAYAWDKLSREQGVTLYGPRVAGRPQAAIIAFNVSGVHPHDLSTVADTFNVQIRAGHHCALPALKRLGLQSTARASLGVYSTQSDIDMLCEAIRRARKVFN